MQLLSTGKQRAGIYSRVLVAAQALCFSSWKADMQGADLDTVNFESYNAAAGYTYDEGINGVLSCGLQFGGDWDAGVDPLGTPPGLYPRDNLATLSFYTSRIDNILWSFPYARIHTSNCGSGVREKVTFACSGKSQGPFTFPTGSV